MNIINSLHTSNFGIMDCNLRDHGSKLQGVTVLTFKKFLHTPSLIFLKKKTFSGNKRCGQSKKSQHDMI